MPVAPPPSRSHTSLHSLLLVLHPVVHLTHLVHPWLRRLIGGPLVSRRAIWVDPHFVAHPLCVPSAAWDVWLVRVSVELSGPESVRNLDAGLRLRLLPCSREDQDVGWSWSLRGTGRRLRLVASINFVEISLRHVGDLEQGTWAWLRRTSRQDLYATVGVAEGVLAQTCSGPGWGKDRRAHRPRIRGRRSAWCLGEVQAC